MLTRKAEYSDLDAICSIEDASFEEPWSRASLEAEYYRDLADIYVAEDNGRIVGYIIVWDIGDESEILTVAVDIAFRRKGIGASLVRWVIFERTGREKSKWFLEAACDNLEAVGLYEKYGFMKIGVIKNYYGHGKHAFRMARAPVGQEV